ncbi:MAG: hypothetical protein ACXAB7_21940, partial [Candidatus Kariarchaeaceae archaeon]
YLNNVEQETNTWSSGNPEIVVLDGFEVGTYNFTMIFRDKFGNTFSYTIMVMVEDTTYPEVTSPPDITFQRGTTGHRITWEITDINNGTYVIYTNGTLIHEDNWSSGDSIEVNLDDLLAASYVFEIVATDDYGNSISDDVLVTVTEGTEQGSFGTILVGTIIVAIIITLGGGYRIIRRRR